jgi:Tfp pilus assembly protein PilF
MKTVRAFTFGAAILVGIVGCSTSSPKVASRHQLDATTAAAVEYAELVDEWGKMDAAEKELRTVLEVDLNNPKARYYLTLVQRSREQQAQPPPRALHPTYPAKPIY